MKKFKKGFEEKNKRENLDYLLNVDQFLQKLVLHTIVPFSNNVRNLNDIIFLEISDGAKGIVFHKG
jgi:hypothetical protein